MNILNSTTIYGVLAILCSILLFGCVPIPMQHSVPSDVRYSEHSDGYYKSITITPAVEEWIVKKFTRAISDADINIEVVDAYSVLKQAVPDSTPNTGIIVGDLQQPEVRDFIREAGVRFIVILGQHHITDDVDYNEKVFGIPYIFGVSSSEMITSKISAGLLDLDDPADMKYLESEAQGKTSGVMISFYLTINDPATRESALSGIAEHIQKVIRSKTGEQAVKIMMVSGNLVSGN